jgi:N-methylhydantoinase B
LLDCRFPAPVAARAHTCQRVVDVGIGALAEALPEQAVGAANGANTTAVFCGRDPRTGTDYLYLETLGGGFGGRATHDGTDGVQVHITNTSNLPIEAIEMEYPLRVESYGFVSDSGGAGQYRGGLGLCRVITPVAHDCVFNGAGERFRNQPWGVFGGEPGARGSFVHECADGQSVRLENKPNAVQVAAGDRVIVRTPGAGGYGPAAQRDEQAIAADERSGKFSAQYIEENYRR